MKIAVVALLLAVSLAADAATPATTTTTAPAATTTTKPVTTTATARPRPVAAPVQTVAAAPVPYWDLNRNGIPDVYEPRKPVEANWADLQ